MTFPLLDIDPKFVFELAAGLEDPDHIAEKYHLRSETWDSLRQDENFRKVVDSKRAELQKSGYTFRLKAALAAEDLLDEVYVGAKSPDASLSAKLESFKYLTKIAGLEPKEDKSLAVGTGFSIKIELGENSITINQSARETIDITPEDELPDAPDYIKDLLPITDDLHATDLQTA